MWEQNRFHGLGKYTFSMKQIPFIFFLLKSIRKKKKDNGNTFEGEFRDDKMYGVGKWLWPKNGDRFEGNFDEDEIVRIRGKGTLMRSNGDVIDADWVDKTIPSSEGGQVYNRIGVGKIEYKSGEVYEGGILDVREKTGEGFVYKDGEGKLRLVDGSNIQGRWKQDVLVGLAILEDVDGNKRKRIYRLGNIVSDEVILDV